MTATYTLLSANAQWPGYASTRAAPWPVRCAKLAAIIKDTDATIVTAQELGQPEAFDLARDLGQRWSYQRANLNTVLWRNEWQLDKERDWDLPSGPQRPPRTLILCRLINDTTKQYVWAGSTHFVSQVPPDMTPKGADLLRLDQARHLVSIIKPPGNPKGEYQQIIIGADSNTRASETNGARSILTRAGFTIESAGIDIVMAKSRIAILSVTGVDLGNASDHDARLAEFSIIDPVSAA